MKRYNMFCSYDGGGPAEEMESPEGDYVLFSDAEAAVKQAREDALDEALRMVWKNETAAGAARAVESLKGKTP